MARQTQEIVNALLRWKGNVAGAAGEMCMRRGSLYERIERLGLDLDAFRSGGANVAAFKQVPGVSGASGMSGVSGSTGQMSGRKSSGRKISPAPYKSEDRRRSLQEMEAANEIAVPIATVPTRHRPFRVNPENQALLLEVTRRLELTFNVKSDPNLILNQVLSECTMPWAEEKQSLAKPAKKAKESK